VTTHPFRPRPARVLVAAGIAALACALLAGCSSSSTSSTTTKPSTTTTTLSAQQVALQPKLLTLADFPKGWIEDTQADAASTAGTPPCLAHVVTAQGSTARVHAVFVGPKTGADAVIQTVASFATGQLPGSVATIASGFLACNGTTFTQGEQTADIATHRLTNLPSGDAGFAAEMELSIGTQHVFLDVFFGTKGDDATVLVWRSPTASPALFVDTAAKALARL
jgi:outer membrane murein-binding lipoprotein Lpp